VIEVLVLRVMWKGGGTFEIWSLVGGSLGLLSLSPLTFGLRYDCVLLHVFPS
jgi:hypothetical protein